MGSSMALFEFVPMAASLAVRSCASMAASLSVMGIARVGSALAVIAVTHLGSTLSLRRFLRFGSAVSLLGMARLGASIALCEHASFGSAVSVRSLCRFAASLSVLACSRLGASMSVLDYPLFGSTLALRAFSRIGACLSFSGNLKIASESSKTSLVFSTIHKVTSNASERVLSFPDKDWDGILHGNWTADYAISTSDRRLKQGIAPLTVQLQKSRASQMQHPPSPGGTHNDDPLGVWALRELRPVSYRFKIQGQEGRASAERYGFIAQEVQKVFPNLVTGGERRVQHLVYQDLLAVLTLSMQEQDADLQLQGKQIAESLDEVQQLLTQAGRLNQLLDHIETGRARAHVSS